MTAPPDSHTGTAKDRVVLYCPHCEYNLTGLPEDRCPECGEPFDREMLIRMARGEAIIPGWPPKLNIRERFAAYFALFYQSVLHPEQLARSFPLVHPEKHAFLYTFYSRAMATAIVLLMAAYILCADLATGTGEFFISDSVTFAITFMSYIWCGSLLMEILTATVLDRVALSNRQRALLKNNRLSPSWSGIVAMHSSFVLLLTSGVCFIQLFAGSFRTARADFPDPFVTTWMLFVSVWWWRNMSISINARAPSKTRAVCGIIAIPLAPFTIIFLIGLCCRMVI